MHGTRKSPPTTVQQQQQINNTPPQQPVITNVTVQIVTGADRAGNVAGNNPNNNQHKRGNIQLQRNVGPPVVKESVVAINNNVRRRFRTSGNTGGQPV